MKNSGIYKITNIKNNNSYIGSSTDLKRREYDHFRFLRSSKHINKHLQNAYNMYGSDSFCFEVIFNCEKDYLLYYEDLFLEHFKPQYNISLSASSPMKGRKHTEESLKKIRAQIPWNKGIPRTEEEKKKMSINRKLAYENLPVEEKKKVGSWNIGRSSYFKGKTHTDKNKKLFRERYIKKANPFKCIETGEVFLLQLDAAKKYKIKQGHISEVLKGKRKSVKSLTFKYLT